MHSVYDVKIFDPGALKANASFYFVAFPTSGDC